MPGDTADRVEVELAPLTRDPVAQAKLNLSLGNAPGRITERDNERKVGSATALLGLSAARQAIDAFVERHVVGRESGSLYISGKPGTGKTALLSEILADARARLAAAVGHASGHVAHTSTAPQDCTLVVINCMALPTPAAVFSVWQRWARFGS